MQGAGPQFQGLRFWQPALNPKLVRDASDRTRRNRAAGGGVAIDHHLPVSSCKQVPICKEQQQQQRQLVMGSYRQQQQ